MEIVETINVDNNVDNGNSRLNLKKNDECTICFNELETDTRILTCGHIFHTSCINTWIKIKSNCPICRKIIYSSDVTFKGRKFYNIFIRYTIHCINEYIIIRVFLLNYLLKKIILKYSLIKKVSYNLHFFTIIYKNNIEDTNDTIFIVKLFNNSNETLFHFLKNKIQIIN